MAIVSEKKVIDEVKTLLKTEFSQANKDKFAVESYPVSLSEYHLKHSNGVILVKELGMSNQFLRDRSGYYYYDNTAWSVMSIGLCVLFQKSFIRQDRVTEISEVCDRIRDCLQCHNVYNKALYVTTMGESVFEPSKNWYYRTLDVDYPYIVEVR